MRSHGAAFQQENATMKSKSSAAKRPAARSSAKTKSAPKKVELDPSVPTMETRVLKASGFSPQSLVADVRSRIDQALRTKLEAECSKQAGDDPDLPIPIGIYASETIALAARIEWHQVPRDGVQASLAPHAARIGEDVAAELVYLADQIRVADSMIAQGRISEPEKLILRGRPILVRLRSALEVVVDDGVRDEKDTVVEALRKKHGSVPSRKAELSTALAAYADCCNLFRAELSNLAGFDLALIEEAAQIADALSASGIGTKVDTKSAMARRNRLVSVTRSRIAKVRRIARYTFSDHPDVVATFFSAFMREQRRGSKTNDETFEPNDDPVDQDPTPTPEPQDDPT